MFTALIASLALVQQSPTFHDTAADDDVCAAMGELSEVVMRLRQNGTPMSELMRLQGDDQFAPLMRSVVIDAYDRPRYSTPQFQRDEIANFRNYVEVTCYTAMERNQ